MRSIKRPGGFLHRIAHQFYTYLLHRVFLCTGWVCQPTRGSAAASRVVKPTRGLLGTGSGQPGGANHPGDRAE